MNKQEQGKKNRAKGARFERKVRENLEAEGWIVDKWTNNVEFKEYDNGEHPKGFIGTDVNDGELKPAKSFRGRTRSNGFPDFICFRWFAYLPGRKYVYEVIGVECKVNGYLDKVEKEKCKWYLDNNIFSKILVASEGKERGEIVYKEFKNE